MSIGSTNYPQPVQVNGFTCHNCTEVDEAKKHIDPAHPKSGPYGVDAATDPTVKKSFIQFGGSLSGTNASGAASTPDSAAASTTASTSPSGSASPTTSTSASQAPGQLVNVLA